MKYARGRINVRQGQTLEFTKKSDSSFLYVNSPEYITKYGIVDDICHVMVDEGENKVQPYLKIFEQENVSGKNTFYQTHTAWWGEGKLGAERFYPKNNFYLDIDFYNPTTSVVTIDISNLTYGVNYDILQNYYNSGVSTEIIIPAGEHRLLFESLNAPLLCTNSQGVAWARTPVILFDFNVSVGGNITVSSLAAYNKENLRLKAGEKNILVYNNAEIDTGEIIYELDEEGNPAWNEHTLNPRPTESDLYAKQKGIARNESAWVDANLEFLIDDSTPNEKNLDIYLSDEFYDDIENPKNKWMTNINPLNDKNLGLIYAMPNQNHRLQYHRDKGGIWNFAFDYRDLNNIFENAIGTEIINLPVPDEIIEKAKFDVSLGWKANFPGISPDETSISMGSYGVTYHYTITVTNNGTRDRVVSYGVMNCENVSFGYKVGTDNVYTTEFIQSVVYNEKGFYKPVNVSVPAKSTVIFEVVYVLAAGHGGIYNAIIVN